jgi:5-methylcytosine-specific restriction endonuclease McrA
MDAATRLLVRQRADDRCEYCRFPQEHAETRHHVEHIRARQHQGSDDPENLALACIHCNSHKGPNLTGIDLESGTIVPLFDPRRDSWNDHFEWVGAHLLGRTPIGRMYGPR